MTVVYEFAHVHVTTMLFGVDVLITQYFQNSPLTEIEACFKADIVTCRRIKLSIVLFRIQRIAGNHDTFCRPVARYTFT